MSTANYNIPEIQSTYISIIEQLEKPIIAIDVKIAALKTATAFYENALNAQMSAAYLQKTLGGVR